MKIPELPNSYNVFTKDYKSNRDWYEKSWSGVLNPLFLVGYGCVYFINKRVTDTYRTAFCYLENNRLHWFWDNRDLERVRKKILTLIKNNPKKIDIWYKQWKKDWQNLEKVFKKIDKFDLKKTSSETIYGLYEELKTAYIYESTLSYLVDSFLSNKETDWFLEELKNEFKRRSYPINDKSLTNITSPVYQTFSQQELIELAALAVKIKNQPTIYNKIKTKKEFIESVYKNNNLLNDFRNHQTRFYWIENSYFQSKPLTVDYFINKSRELLLNEKNINFFYKIENNKTKINAEVKNNILNKINISMYHRRLIQYADKFAKWQDTRKAGVFRANHYIFAILKEISRRYKLPKNLVYFTYDPEMKDLMLYGKINKNIVKSRQKGCAFFVCPKGWKFFENDEFKRLDKSFFEQVDKNIKIIKGVTACPGKVEGRARVILNIKDLNKLKKGEILVTNNTTPDFVPAMKKAGAIITEQGGITTHAAIVSRELNKPCIIGTKIATKVIKTGQQIEVDANKGVVRKIK